MNNALLKQTIPSLHFRPYLALAVGMVGLFTSSIGMSKIQEPGVHATAGAVEAFSKRVAPLLQEIASADWKSVAGSRLNETYQILSGDTLYGISAKLFGDPKHWPRVWALNSKKITNPHRIDPAMTLSFLPGIEQAVAEATAEVSQKNTIPKGSLIASRSDEWRYLPVQPWESVPLQIAPEVDSTGFDRRSAVKRNIRRSVIETQLIGYASEVSTIGMIIAGRSETDSLSNGDVVYVVETERPPEPLQIAKRYLVISPAEEIDNPNDKDETVYSYRALGRVEIISKTGRTFSGIITRSFDAIPRGSFLVPDIPAKVLPVPIPGPTGEGRLIATVLTDPRQSSGFTAQTHQVHLTLGEEDGIRPGMVFRSYQTMDPRTDYVISKDGLLKESDVMVLNTNTDYSVGIVIAGKDALLSGTEMALLTDVSSVLQKAKPLRGEAQLFEEDKASSANTSLPPPAPETVPPPTSNTENNSELEDDDSAAETSEDEAEEEEETAPAEEKATPDKEEDESEIEELSDDDSGDQSDSSDDSSDDDSDDDSDSGDSEEEEE